MPRTVGLIIGAVCVFGVVAALMLKLMPGPLKDTDYLVIGSVATLVAVLVVFVGMIAGTKSSDTFFKKRKKQG
jgi:hypothetical protein